MKHTLNMQTVNNTPGYFSPSISDPNSTSFCYFCPLKLFLSSLSYTSLTWDLFQGNQNKISSKERKSLYWIWVSHSFQSLEQKQSLVVWPSSAPQSIYSAYRSKFKETKKAICFPRNEKYFIFVKTLKQT